MKKTIKFILHFTLVVFLTVVTQVGGLLYLIALVTFRRKTSKYREKRLGLFVSLYAVSNLILIPNLAPVFGREKINQSEFVAAHTFMTNVMHRNYVKPALNQSLEKIGKSLSKKHKGVKLVYLDANFPFIDNFPLLPHLSHNNGKKIDLSFIYTDSEGKMTNEKPSISGYGVYEGPRTGEYNQIKKCLNQGNWQYDFPKYITFGTIYPNLRFSEKATKDLILEILKQPTTGKFFIEPHLKTRLHLRKNKIRYHGCQAVRHDDHIHFQLQ